MGTTMLGGFLTIQKITAAITAAQVETANAVLTKVTVPGDALIHDVIIEVTDMDDGATGTIDVGDSAGPTVPDDDRFIAALSIQAAGNARAAKASGLLEDLPYQYSTTGEQDIEVTVKAVAATGADGTLSLIHI